MSRTLPRRTFLRGLGTVMALPALEAMAPAAGFAATAAKAAGSKAHGGAPLRMAFLFVPNGIHMQDWRPAAEGTLNQLPPTLQPLAGVKEHLNVLTGLAQHNAFALKDGPGDHARSVAAFLTGCHPRKTAGADIKNGISVDQYAAREIGNNTRFPSLEIGCERGAQAGNCDSGYSCAYSSNLSWRSETTPVPKEVDPRLVFERFFTNGDPGESAEVRAKRDRYRKSILDFVMEDASRLKSQLGVRDQRKLDEYFTAVREIEQRIARAGKDVLEATGLKTPAGIPQEYGDHLKLMADLMVLAFQGDLTRISTFMFANDGSNRPYRAINIPEGHHDLSHHGNDPAKQAKIAQINKFHISALAYMLEKMKGIEEPGGTMLDNVMIVYGAGISDGNAHNHDDLPILLAGRGGGTIRTGRHLKYAPNTPLNNLFLSMLDRMHVPVHSLGDSTGRLDGLV
jgi:hypothetical protein